MSRPNKLLATLPVIYAANAPPTSAALQCSPKYARVSVKADAMHSPCAMRRTINVVKSGAAARRAVGIASTVRLMRRPRRRSMRWHRQEGDEADQEGAQRRARIVAVHRHGRGRARGCH